MTWELHRHDARRVSELLQPGSVDLVVTSPPYFALRSYRDGGEHYAGQLGSEPTPGDYVDALIECTADWLKVLRPGGSIFVNLGDKRAGSGGGNQSGVLTHRNAALAQLHDNLAAFGAPRRYNQASDGIPTKSLMGLPWRYALHCVDELGLILRADIIWSKPNGLPESVKDRVRASHEYVFHLTREPRYFAAVDEVREAHIEQQRPGVLTWDERRGRSDPGARYSDQNGHGGTAGMAQSPLGKVPGSVWSIPSEPLTPPVELGVDHFAAFPSELVRRIVLGWSPSGWCTACGEALRPVVTAVGLDMSRPQARRAHQLAEAAGLGEAHVAALLAVGISDVGRGAATQSGAGKNAAETQRLADEARKVLGGYAREYLLRRPTSLGYACGCTPYTDHPAETWTDERGNDRLAPPHREYHFGGGRRAAATTPAVVLDPFAGTGTTCAVAHHLGRHGIGVDLSADYLRLAEWRCSSDTRLRDKVLHRSGRPAAPTIDGQLSLLDEAAS
jgi:DNA modification methylase